MDAQTVATRTTRTCKGCDRTLMQRRTVGRPRLYCEHCRPRRNPRPPARPPAAKPAAPPQARPQPRRRRRNVPDGCPLTFGELDAVCALANGTTRKEHAYATGRSESTIRSQLATAYQRLGVTNATQATIHCWKSGWLIVDGLTVRIAPKTTPPPKITAANRVTPEQKLFAEAAVRALRTHDPADDLEARVLLRIVRRKAAERAAAASIRTRTTLKAPARGPGLSQPPDEADGDVVRHSRTSRPPRVDLRGVDYVWLPASDPNAWEGDGWYFFSDGSGVLREEDPTVIAELERGHAQAAAPTAD